VGSRSIGGSLDLADYLMEEAHLAVVPGVAFGEDRCIRLSFALSMDELKEGFDRLEKALGRLG
jgi:aspartate aminotransferase